MKHGPETTPAIIEAFEVSQCNENSEICKKCGGHCCKSMGCEIFPQDVKRWFNTDTITVDMILKLLDSGYVCLDWWDGEIREEFEYPDKEIEDYRMQSFYLHMRNKFDAAVEGSYGGMCRALGENGCTIPWEKRPTGGKALIPSTTGNSKDCDSEVSKPECALAWTPYDDILSQVYNDYEAPEGEDSVDYLFKRISDTFKDAPYIP